MYFASGKILSISSEITLFRYFNTLTEVTKKKCTEEKSKQTYDIRTTSIAILHILCYVHSFAN
jgi:hypothetical protein